MGRLADQIIDLQRKEIAEMRQLIADLERNPISSEAPELLP